MASPRTPRSDAILDFASQIKSAVIAAVIFPHSGFVLQRRSGQQGLAGTGRFAALRRRGTIDVAVPGAASEPSPEPLRPQALGMGGTCWGSAGPPATDPQWISHQQDQSTGNELRTEQFGPETLLELLEHEKLHSIAYI